MTDRIRPQAGDVPPSDPIGAFCKDNHASLVGSPIGPLSGLSFAAKDVFQIEGATASFGNPQWLATHSPATGTAEAVTRVLAAGANMVARAHTDELCYSIAGENVHYGTPVNVNAPGRIPGGSSSGSAAAVAAGLVDFALGTDCGGSVRIPASYCGIFGIRPTMGRVSTRGALEFAPSFDVTGWFARDAALLKRVGEVLLPAKQQASELKGLLLARDVFEEIDGSVQRALALAVENVATHFSEIRDVTISAERAGWYEVFSTIQGFEVWRSVGGWVTETKPELGPGVAERVARAATITQEMYDEAKAEQARIREQVENLIGEGNALCLPTSPCVAPPRGMAADAVQVALRGQSMRILCIAGLAGLPQLTMPFAKLDGMPLGLSLIGPRDSDEALLALAEKISAPFKWDGGALVQGA
jgi:amidase